MSSSNDAIDGVSQASAEQSAPAGEREACSECNGLGFGPFGGCGECCGSGRAAPAQPAAQDQGEVHSRERWTVMCGHWQDTTLAIHGERTGHIASGIDEDAAHAIVNAHNQGLPPIAAASTGQEVKP